MAKTSKPKEEQTIEEPSIIQEECIETTEESLPVIEKSEETTQIADSIEEPSIIQEESTDGITDLTENVCNISERIIELEKLLASWKWSGWRQNKIRQEIEELKKQL